MFLLYLFVLLLPVSSPTTYIGEYIRAAGCSTLPNWQRRQYTVFGDLYPSSEKVLFIIVFVVSVYLFYSLINLIFYICLLIVYFLLILKRYYADAFEEIVAMKNC